MAKIKVTGLDTFTTQLSKLSSDVTKINRGTLGEGARVVADAVKTALNSMPTHPDGEWGTAQHKLYGATESEKQQIIENFGIATFKQDSGNLNTAVGFTGYVNTPSKRFSGRIPTGMLMQCIEYGTSFRQGTHTVANAVSGIKKNVETAMQTYMDNETNKIMK